MGLARVRNMRFHALDLILPPSRLISKDQAGGESARRNGGGSELRIM